MSLLRSNRLSSEQVVVMARYFMRQTCEACVPSPAALAQGTKTPAGIANTQANWDVTSGEGPQKVA